MLIPSFILFSVTLKHTLNLVAHATASYLYLPVLLMLFN